MVLVGAILLVLGIAAVRSAQPAFTYLLFGALLIIIGFALWNKLRRKQRRSTRFSLFRRRDREDNNNEQDNNGWGDW